MDFSLHTTFPESLKTEWNDLLAQSFTHVPFLRHEYLSAWWHHLGGGEWAIQPTAVTQRAVSPTSAPFLQIITARENGHLVGIAPLFHARHEERDSLLLLGSIEISDYLDLIVRPADLDRFLVTLLPFLAGNSLPKWDALDLYNILDSSPTLPALEKATMNLSWTYQSTKLKHCPYIPLPGDFEAYLAGIDKKQRHEIRRKMRRIDGNASTCRWSFSEDPHTLAADADAFLTLMAMDPEKSKFLTPGMCELFKEIIRCAFENGCLKLAFLEIEGKKASAYLNFDYLNRVWVYNSGLDWSFNEYSPGWVLLGYLLRWANENHRTEFDFMRGDEEYKYRFGAIDRFVMRALVTPPSR
jgi:CelD/BcsL family acetyltransferase involved in cellulose biosynthesis